MSIKSQKNKFADVDEFLYSIEEEELKIVNLLRELIFDSIPVIREKLAYNVPFYSMNKNICFLWPASVLWGKKKTYEGVRLGFNKGYLLNDEFNILKKDNRKYVYWLDFTAPKQVNQQMIKEYLIEASILDKVKY